MTDEVGESVYMTRGRIAQIWSHTVKPRTMSSETSRACFDGDGVATGVGAGGGALTGEMSDSVREVRSITI